MRKSITKQKEDKAKMKSSTLKRVEILERIALSKKDKILLNKVEKIKNCCSILGEQENTKTTKKFVTGRCCGYYRYCEICANRRKNQKATSVYNYINTNKKIFEGKNFYYIVLTLDRRKHCNLSFGLKEWLYCRDILVKRYQNSARKSHKKKSFFRGDGMVISIEIEHNKKRGWNHHMNIVLCTEKKIPISTWIDKDGKKASVNNELFEEWADISSVGKIPSVVYIEKIKGLTGIKKVISYINKFSKGIDNNLKGYVSAMENKKNKYKLWSTYGIFQKCFQKNKKMGKHIHYTKKKFIYNSAKEAYL